MASVGSVRCDHLDALLIELFVERVTVVGLVSDDEGRLLSRQHEVEELLHELRLVMIRRSGVDRDPQPASIDQDHDFHAFSCLRAADPIAAPLRLAEGAVDEALVQPVLAALLDQPSSTLEDGLEHSGLHPGLEPTVHRALAAELARQVLPLRAVVEDPEDPSQDHALVDYRPTTKRTARRIRNPSAHPVELLVAESQHATAYEEVSAGVDGFWDSLYNASAQVFSEPPNHSRFVWIADLLPNELRDPVAAMMDQGLNTIMERFG